MKVKILSILLMFCLVLPIATTVAFLRHQKKQVRKEIKHKIIAGVEREELVLLKFSIQDSRTSLNWKHSREFEFNGDMYDIVEKEINGDTIYYWCWWDNQETELNRKLNKILISALDDNPQQKENQKKLVNLYKYLYHSAIPSWQVFIDQTEILLFSYNCNYSSNNLSPPIPPPKRC